MQHCGVIVDPIDDEVEGDAIPLPIQHEPASTIMPETWVKAAGVIRANSLIRGQSAVRWVLLERLEQMLQNNIVPLVPMRGSISASGGKSFISTHFLLHTSTALPCWNRVTRSDFAPQISVHSPTLPER
jgi:phenylalanine ammonia-lyase